MKKKFMIEYSGNDKQIGEFLEWKHYNNKRQAVKAVREFAEDSDHFKIHPIMFASIGDSAKTVRPLMK